MPNAAKEEFDAQAVLLCQWSRSIAMLDLVRLKDVIGTASEGPAAVFMLKLIDAAEGIQEVIDDFPELVTIPHKQPQPEARAFKEPSLFRKR